jgi:hypothetical protein
MQIRSDERVFICAKTGAGKTTYVKRFLLAGYPRVIFWDIKKQNSDWHHQVVCRNPDGLRSAIQKGFNQILYQPNDISSNDFNRVCEIIYNTGNIALYVDEVAYITTGSNIEYYHKLLLIMGRSRGIGVITATQRPRHVSNFCISESEHFFIGKLQLEDDIKKISIILPKEYRNQPQTLQKYTWIYTDTETTYIIPETPL